jgi:SEC-C motif domain protein
MTTSATDQAVMASAPADEGGCPCGTTLAFARCCQPVLAGAAAPTAVALMRSRYCAYVTGAIDYLIATHDPETRATLDVDAMARWSRTTVWGGLTIVATVDGGVDDADGVVEFVVRGVTAGTGFAQRERSRFRRSHGRWCYRDGTGGPEPVRAVATVGRNEVCPCGSGVKFKRCHGA